MGTYEIQHEANIARNQEKCDALGITGKDGLVESAGEQRRRAEAVKKAAKESRRQTKEKKAAAALAVSVPRRQSNRLQPIPTTLVPTQTVGAVTPTISPEIAPTVTVATSMIAPPSTPSVASKDSFPVLDPTLIRSPDIPLPPTSLLSERPFTGQDFKPLSSSVNIEGWPTWMQTYFAYLLNEEWGVEWVAMVTVWSELERIYGFTTPVSLSLS
jgi:hypothetical protein